MSKNFSDFGKFAIKGFILCAIPPLILILEGYFNRIRTFEFLAMGIGKTILIGLVGGLAGIGFYPLRTNYKKISKYLAVTIVLIYYLAFFIYFGMILYFNVQNAKLG